MKTHKDTARRSIIQSDWLRNLRHKVSAMASQNTFLIGSSRGRGREGEFFL